MWAERIVPVFALSLAMAAAQDIVVNPGGVKWKEEMGGAESVVLREDSKSGGLELLARYPPRHVFPPHWHESNERILLIEGRLSLNETFLEAGGFAFLPAGKVQKLACVSQTRCSFYVAWDGNPASHKAQ